MNAVDTSRPIVVADDDEDDLFFARRSLEKSVQGTRVLTCQDGAEVVSLLTTVKADSSEVPLAVFLDVKMPNMDGFQVLKWIRAQKRFAHVAVFMLSGSAEARDIDLARSLGANDYFVKYPRPEQLARAVGSLKG